MLRVLDVRRALHRRRWSDPGPLTPDESDQAAFFSDDCEPWVWLCGQVRQLEPMKDVRAAAQECQVAVAHLTSYADEGGPIAHEVLRRLQSFTLDLHHESRRLQGRPVPNPSASRIGVREWLQAAVDSGELYGSDLATLRLRHRINSVLHVAGAVATAALVAAGHTLVALGTYVVTAVAVLVLRYLSNAEAGSTMRARFFSCLTGHTSDIALALTMAVWSERAGHGAWSVLPLAAAAAMAAGIIVRVGALQGGAYVPRPRYEAVVRVPALTIGLAGVAARRPEAFAMLAVALVAYFGREAHESFTSVWNAGATETAWTAVTEEGYRSHVFVAPHPNDDAPADAPMLKGRHPSARTRPPDDIDP